MTGIESSVEKPDGWSKTELRREGKETTSTGCVSVSAGNNYGGHEPVGNNRLEMDGSARVDAETNSGSRRYELFAAGSRPRAKEDKTSRNVV